MRKENSPIYKVSSLGKNLRKWTHSNRRVGRPRMNWTEETVKEIWDHIKKNDQRYKYTAFDDNNEEIMGKIRTYAGSSIGSATPPHA